MRRERSKGRARRIEWGELTAIPCKITGDFPIGFSFFLFSFLINFNVLTPKKKYNTLSYFQMSI
jgi:hypothetical protein